MACVLRGARREGGAREGGEAQWGCVRMAINNISCQTSAKHTQ